MKNFHAEIRPGYESYRLRVKVPLRYTDGLWRIYVYSWTEKNEWHYSINAHSRHGFPSREAAATAALEELKTSIAALQSVTLTDLTTGLGPATLPSQPPPPENVP